VFIAGYSFTVGKLVLAPLHTAMVERGVRARIVLDCSQVDVEGDSEPVVLKQTVDGFWERNWKSSSRPIASVYCIDSSERGVTARMPCCSTRSTSSRGSSP
jgi:hypothetical protein